MIITAQASGFDWTSYGHNKERKREEEQGWEIRVDKESNRSWDTKRAAGKVDGGKI